MFHSPQIIVERTDEVLRVYSFREASRVTVLCIVQMHTLHISCETQLIAACSRWAEHRALLGEVSDNTDGLRQALGPVFQHLRFLTLTAEEFADGAVKLRILSSEEKVAMYGVLIQKSFDGLPPGFSTMAGKRKMLQLKPPTFTFTPEINNFYSSANAGVNATNAKLCYKCKRAKSPPPAGVVCSVSFSADCEIRMLGLAFPKETNLLKPRVHVQNSRNVTQDTGTASVAVTNAILLMFQKPVHVPRGEIMYVMVAQDTGECRLMNFRSSVGHNVFSERSLAANPNASCITGIFYKRA